MPATKPKETFSHREIDQMFSQAREASELLKALSNETRLLILCLLMEGEKTVGEIEDAVGLAQATVSQHLSRLRLERLIEDRREGRQIYYQICDENVTKLMGTLHELFCQKN